MAGEKVRIWSSAKFWLGVVLVLWVATAGTGGFCLATVYGLKAMVLRMEAAAKEHATREEALTDNMGPVLVRLSSLEDQRGVWERQRQEYEAILTAQRAHSQEVLPLLERARKLESQRDLYAAMQVYSDAAQVDGNSPAVASGLKGITEAVREKQEKEKYIASIRLYDFIAKFYKSWTDEKEPGIEFKLQNNGDRTLSRVTVTVYFKDAAGKTIHEQRVTPVNSSSWSSPTVLRPGYIWQLERGKFLTSESVPTEWQPGPNSAHAEITDIEFAAE